MLKYINLQIPLMDEFPNPKSVIVLDNAKIHHSNELVEMVEEFGGRVEFLPSYSTDFNPIEEAFSAIKNWVRCNKDWMDEEDDIQDCMGRAFGQVGAEQAVAFFRH